MEDMIRGPEELGPRVRSVAALSGYRLDLMFSNGERRIYDAAPLLDWPAYRALKDESVFSSAHAEYGTVCWPGDVDCCPDRLYRDSVPV
ncbi:MAG: DUF2442 domain-containing protein [Clostridia bacterium]|nr:DUF2442 domain-containing protein [Clostridia bacterium]